MEKFYYVHNRKTGNPTFRHQNKEDAIAEAVRLSKKLKKNFYVLESVSHIVYNDGDVNVDSESNNVEEEIDEEVPIILY